MKNKYILSIALAAAGMLTSCNMDLAPVGSLDEDVALQTVNDLMTFRNGFYSSARAVTSSAFFTYADIQCDMFNGLTVNGNRMGAIANGNIYSNNSEPEGYWNSFWYCINNINYFLEYAGPIYDKYVADNEEYKADCVSLYIAEGYFFRAYYYSLMFDRWCQAYSAALADQPALGLPIVTKYNPTPNRAEYPGRSTMKATIDFFLNDLQLAYNGILAWEQKYPELATSEYPEDMDGRLLPNASYISSWCCKALQARVALWMNDYAKAQSLAQEVIDCGIYSMSTTDSFQNMWKSDQSTEIIYMPYESTAELGNAIGANYLNNSAGADYIPVPKLIEDMQAAGKIVDRFGRVTGYKDCRYKAYIDERNIKSAFGNIKAPVFNKFPGNASLQTDQGANNYVNKPKPFRLTEMYFIVAECAYMQQNEAKANEMMKYYMEHRIKYDKNEGYEDLSGQALLNEIRHQKGIEFVGEGMRLSDLRRWKMGFNRATGADYMVLNYDGVSQILTKAGLEVEYTTTDHRYTWPIPSTELQVNPQMAGQQNPGY